MGKERLERSNIVGDERRVIISRCEDGAAECERMTSLEIAEVTGKQHNHVMRDIRNMEPAWEKVTQSKFGLSTYKDSTGRTLPCYLLTKTECLYVATKFNDEARARLVLRWEELERKKDPTPNPSRGRGVEGPEMRLLVTERELALQCDLRRREEISRENAPADGCYTASEVAFMLEMTVKELNKALVMLGIQYWNGSRYRLTTEYADRGYAQDRAFHYYALEGEKKQRHYMVWTPEGVEMIKFLIHNS